MSGKFEEDLSRKFDESLSIGVPEGYRPFRNNPNAFCSSFQPGTKTAEDFLFKKEKPDTLLAVEFNEMGTNRVMQNIVSSFSESGSSSCCFACELNFREN